jgi:hypothetical protein
MLDHGELFAVAYHQDTLNETAEDFRTRGIWLKKNRSRLAGHCAAMVASYPLKNNVRHLLWTWRSAHGALGCVIARWKASTPAPLG